MTRVTRIERIYSRSGKVLTVRPDATIARAAQVMNHHEVGCLLVTDTQLRPLGIVTERDILGKVVAPAANPKVVRVADIMTTDVVSVGTDATVEQAEQLMTELGIRHLPIIENGVARGMLSSRDLMAHKLKATGALAMKQSAILTELERQYPGITEVEVDSSGWMVL